MNHAISGRTRIVPIVGTPIEQVTSPADFNTWFAENQTDCVMVGIEIAEPCIADFVRVFRGWTNSDGFVVTSPFKADVAKMVDRLTSRARLLGAVNVVHRAADGTLTGDNVDGAGFMAAARAHGFQAEGRSALVVGAGGAGAAIAHVLCECKIAQLSIIDLDQARSQRLADALRLEFSTTAIRTGRLGKSVADVDLVVNASTAGMNGDGGLPLPELLLATLSPGSHAADAVTAPVLTPFLLFAQGRGCTIQTGPEMASAQMLALGRFVGVVP